MEGLEKKDTYEQKMIALERELEELEKKRNERKARREKRLAELKVKENEIEELRRGLSKRAASPTNRNFFKQKEGKPDEQVEGYGVNMYNSDVLKKTKPENFKNPQNNSTISEKELKKYSGRAEDGKSQSVINFSKYKVSKETNISTTGFDDKLKTKKKIRGE